MPIYEYRCNECGHQFEVSQRMSDDPVSECEVCGGAVQRVLFAPAIHFKGTGFHNTDYGTRRRGPAAEDGGGSGSGDAAGANGSSGGAATATETASSSGSSSSSSGGTTVGLDKV